MTPAYRANGVSTLEGASLPKRLAGQCSWLVLRRCRRAQPMRIRCRSSRQFRSRRLRCRDSERCSRSSSVQVRAGPLAAFSSSGRSALPSCDVASAYRICLDRVRCLPPTHERAGRICRVIIPRETSRRPGNSNSPGFRPVRLKYSSIAYRAWSVSSKRTGLPVFSGGRSRDRALSHWGRCRRRGWRQRRNRAACYRSPS